MKSFITGVQSYIDNFLSVKSGEKLPIPDRNVVVSYILIGLVTPIFYLCPSMVSSNQLFVLIDLFVVVLLSACIVYIGISASRGKQILLFYNTVHLWLFFYIIAFGLLLWMYFCLSEPFCYIALMVVFLPMLPLLLSVGVIAQYLRRVWRLPEANINAFDFVGNIDVAFLNDISHDRHYPRIDDKKRVNTPKVVSPYQIKSVPQESIPMPPRESGPVTAPVGSMEWAVQISDNIE